MAAGERGPERQVALFKAVNALADQLRGVFVPYFRNLLNLSVDHLGGSRSMETAAGTRKKRKSAGSGIEGPVGLLLKFEVRETRPMVELSCLSLSPHMLCAKAKPAGFSWSGCVVAVASVPSHLFWHKQERCVILQNPCRS